MEFVQQHLSAIIAVAACVVVLYLVAGWLGKRKKVFAEDMTLNVRCRKCSWQGTVTKYNQVCRKCNGKDLQHL